MIGAWRRVAAAVVVLVPAWALAGVRVGSLEISGAPADEPGPYAWLMGEADPTLDEIVSAVDAAAGRDDLDTVFIRLKDADLSAAQVEEIGRAMSRAREAGKKVRLFAEFYGPADLMLGAFADEVILQRGGMVSLPGLYMEEMFLADALAWLGVKADLVQVGDYKGASEQMTRSAPSPAWEQNISQLLDTLYENQRAILKRGRGMNDARLDAAMRTAWEADGEEALKAGLIDTVLDLPDIDGHLSPDGGAVAWEDLAPAPASGMSLSSPWAIFAELERIFSPPGNRPDGPSIGVVHIAGPIVDGDSSAGGLLGGASVGSRTIRNALEDAENEPDIRGVIVRIDSPGGSATASEVIWQGVRRLAAKKPVWVSVGSMAASGGYYIAVAGDRIYVNPSSIVGSIGVVGGKFSMGPLYEKLNIHVVGRGRGPMAEFQSSTSPWTPEQVALVREKMTRVYDLFTSRVAAGRPGIDLAKTAEGRLFAGQKAIDLRLADRVGGLSEALEDMASELGLEDYGVVHYPGPKGLGELFEDAFGGLVRAPGMRAAGLRGAGSRAAGAGGGGVALEAAASVLRDAVGPKAWPGVRDALGGLMQLRNEPVVVVAPRVMVFR